MNEFKVIFATVLIFAAGVISGGLLVNYADVSHLKVLHCLPGHYAVGTLSNAVTQVAVTNTVKAARTSSRIPEILSKQFVDRLEDELQLTLGQRANIERIIADGQDEARKSFQDVRSASREKIRKQLTSKQVKQFDELLKQQHPSKKTPPNTNAPASSATNSTSVTKANIATD